MNKRVLVISIAVVLLLVVAGFALKRSPEKQIGTTGVKPQVTDVPRVVVEPATQSSIMLKSEKVTVKYTESGFSPRSVTVKSGTVVTFINESTKKLQITSIAQEGQAELPGFSQFMATGKGSTFSFTFHQRGEWGYVNKGVGSHTGIIVVK